MIQLICSKLCSIGLTICIGIRKSVELLRAGKRPTASRGRIWDGKTHMGAYRRRLDTLAQGKHTYIMGLKHHCSCFWIGLLC